jgi:hypothetical protein
MNTKSKTTSYIVHSIAAALLLLTAQISLAGSARWLLSPQDSAWENLSNWTIGGPPNGPSDTATFGPSSQRDVNISTSVEVNSIVFASNSDSFTLNVSPSDPGVRGELIFSGTGIQEHNSVLQTFVAAGKGGQIIFNNTSTAGEATIISAGDDFNGAGYGTTIFNDLSTAGSATLVAGGGVYAYRNGAILFNDTSSGGSAHVRVVAGFPSNAPDGYLDISGHQSGLTIGSLEGGGYVFLGANDLTVGTNNIDTAFSGIISNDGHRGSLAKVGSGVLTLQTNYCIGDTVGLILVSGSIINLDFTGPPDTIASLMVNGVPQPPGLYGSMTSGAQHTLPEFAGSGTVHVLAHPPGTQLGNISTRSFVQTGDNVMIGGFIVQGGGTMVIIRAIGPELTQYGVPNPLYNPTLELHDGTGALIASNDNWQRTIIGGIITRNQEQDIIDSGHAPTDGRESAIIAYLGPGNYTAVVRGVDNMTGVGLVEVYDLTADAGSILGNISTRAFVQTDDNVMIGGFIVQGPYPKRVIIRAIGPELSAPPFNIPDALADPTLELHDHTGALIASNDNWQHTIIGGIITTDQVQDIMDSGHAPTQPSESAMIADLPPGNYTAIVRGVNNTTGVALVEVYDFD